MPRVTKAGVRMASGTIAREMMAATSRGTLTPPASRSLKALCLSR